MFLLLTLSCHIAIRSLILFTNYLLYTIFLNYGFSLGVGRITFLTHVDLLPVICTSSFYTKYCYELMLHVGFFYAVIFPSVVWYFYTYYLSSIKHVRWLSLLSPSVILSYLENASFIGDSDSEPVSDSFVLGSIMEI